MRDFGTFAKEAQRWQFVETSLITLLILRPKKSRSMIVFNSFAVGWSNLMWSAVTSPGRIAIGTTIASLVDAKVSDLGTTIRPSLAIVTLFKYLLTLGIVVSFLEGLVPWIS